MIKHIHWQLSESFILLFKILWAYSVLRCFISNSKSYDKRLILLLNLWEHKLFFPRKSFITFSRYFLFPFSMCRQNYTCACVYTIKNKEFITSRHTLKKILKDVLWTTGKLSQKGSLGLKKEEIRSKTK